MKKKKVILNFGGEQHVLDGETATVSDSPELTGYAIPFEVLKEACKNTGIGFKDSSNCNHSKHEYEGEYDSIDEGNYIRSDTPCAAENCPFLEGGRKMAIDEKGRETKTIVEAHLYEVQDELVGALKMGMGIGSQCSRWFLAEFRNKAKAAIENTD